MKLATIKKALIKQTIVVVFSIALVSAPAFYANYLYEDYATQSKNVESQGNIVAAEVATLLAQFESANSDLNAYNEIEQKKTNNMLNISKALLRDTIAEVRKTYNFADFDVNMSDVKAKVGDKYKLETVFAEDSNVTIKFSAMSDADAFFLMQSIQNSFSAVKLTSIKLSIDKSLDASALLEIKNACFSSLVKGEIAFTWSDLQNVKKDDTEALTRKAKGSEQNAIQEPQRRIRLRQAQ
jgi:hypothetical protein